MSSAVHRNPKWNKWTVPWATWAPFTSCFIISCLKNKETNSNNNNKKSLLEKNPDLKYHATCLVQIPADAEKHAGFSPVHNNLCLCSQRAQCCSLSLQKPPLLEVHRDPIREAGAGSEPSAMGMLLREVGSTQRSWVVNLGGGTSVCLRACPGGNAS